MLKTSLPIHHKKRRKCVEKNPHLIGTNQKTNDECPPYFQSPPSPIDYRQSCIQEKDTLFLMPKTPKVFKGQYEDEMKKINHDHNLI